MLRNCVPFSRAPGSYQRYPPYISTLGAVASWATAAAAANNRRKRHTISARPEQPRCALSIAVILRRSRQGEQKLLLLQGLKGTNAHSKVQTLACNRQLYSNTLGSVKSHSANLRYCETTRSTICVPLSKCRFLSFETSTLPLMLFES